MNTISFPPVATSLLLAVIVAALLSAIITWVSHPVLQRYALARPNARSSHSIPTPQGAGIAVVFATLLVSLVWAAWLGVAIPAALPAATLVIAFVGLSDDIASLPIVIRLMLQTASVAVVVIALPDSLRITPWLPFPLERGMILLAGVWFVNLVNFMDGLDLMTVTEVVPITATLVLLGWSGDLPLPVAVVAAALCGATLGFAPFNRPVAKVFLGDVGSLPMGLLLGWCLLQLAWEHPFAAVLLPAYYLADSTITLLRRLVKREPFWLAHRSHFYQQATDNGFSVSKVTSEVFSLNIFLALVASATINCNSTLATVLALLAGVLGTGFVLWRFARNMGS